MSNKNEQQGRRRRGVIAGAIGVSLLIGGTFALWSDSGSQTGGTITNGNLDVASVGDVSYYDVSADRTDVTAAANPVSGLDGHTIADIAAYNIVPGDTIQANYPFSVALLGDNLVASVEVALPASSTAATGVSFTAQAYFSNDGTTWTSNGSEQTLTAGTAATVDLGRVQAANQLNGTVDAGSIPVVDNDVVSLTDANVVVVVTGEFDPTTSNQTSVLATSILGAVTTNIAQVRTSGVGNFS